jgi:hypothetical protein
LKQDSVFSQCCGWPKSSVRRRVSEQPSLQIDSCRLLSTLPRPSDQQDNRFISFRNLQCHVCDLGRVLAFAA